MNTKAKKEFEKKFDGSNVFWKVILKHLTPEVIAFIKRDYSNTIDQAITKARNEVLEEVEKKLPWKIHNVSEKEVVWNQYRNKVISILKSLTKEK